MSDISSKIENMIEDLGSISDPQDKFVYIVERAKSAPDFPEEAKIDQFRVPGCLSHMWIYPRSEGNICYYQVESDAQIPKGIAVLITELFDGQAASDIIATDVEFIKDLGIAHLLSPNRRNALSHIISYVKAYAKSLVDPAVQNTSTK